MPARMAEPRRAGTRWGRPSMTNRFATVGFHLCRYVRSAWSGSSSPGGARSSPSIRACSVSPFNASVSATRDPEFPGVIEDPLLVGVGRCSLEDADGDPGTWWLAFVLDPEELLPCQVEHRGIEAVLVKGEGLVLEDEVHDRGLQGAVRDKGEGTGNDNVLLPATTAVDQVQEGRDDEDN